MTAFTVGFDLDMTLIDAREGIGAVYAALSAETGVPVDIPLVVSRLGPTLETELANWYPAGDVPAAAARYRELYAELGIPGTALLPGARGALDAVRRHGGRVVVVTGKHEPSARMHVEHLALPVDAVVGGLWSVEKGAALREHGVSVYVGDHLGDVAGAKVAGALAVGVPTGPISGPALRDAGADVVLDDLTAFPEWLDGHVADVRLAELERRLRELGTLAVAFSGGADSAFLLAAAVRTLGAGNVLGVIAVSASLPASELASARTFAADLGVRLREVRTDEISRAGYRRNGGDRCRFCKLELMSVVIPTAAEAGIRAVATGTNADDVIAGFRPGIAAAAESGAVTPLLDSGLTKAGIRLLSRRWGLPTWDKPAAACLSSRVAFGVEITPGRLARVERAEEALRARLREAGIAVRNVRVRDLGGTARIEVDAERVDAVRNCGAALDAVRGAGFDRVEVDPRGYREGAMNELLENPDAYR